MSGNKIVRASVRTLQVLEALNNRGTAELAELERATGIPKSTLVRVLQTLIAAGYARHLSRGGGYTLTERVLRLSSGFAHSDIVVSIAQPLLDDFTDKHKWSAGLATFHKGALRLRYSTFSHSPIATNIPKLGGRVPLLTSAHGQVYFAFCSETERSAMIEILSQSPHLANQLARDRRGLEAMVRDVRRKGYSLRPVTPTDPIMGLAVPVLHKGTARASIGFRFFRSAVSSEHALRTYLGPLKSVAKAISTKLAQDGKGPPGGIRKKID